MGTFGNDRDWGACGTLREQVVEGHAVVRVLVVDVVPERALSLIEGVAFGEQHALRALSPHFCSSPRACYADPVECAVIGKAIVDGIVTILGLLGGSIFRVRRGAVEDAADPEFAVPTIHTARRGGTGGNRVMNRNNQCCAGRQSRAAGIGSRRLRSHGGGGSGHVRLR